MRPSCNRRWREYPLGGLEGRRKDGLETVESGETVECAWALINTIFYTLYYLVAKPFRAASAKSRSNILLTSVPSLAEVSK